MREGYIFADLIQRIIVIHSGLLRVKTYMLLM